MTSRSRSFSCRSFFVSFNKASFSSSENEAKAAFVGTKTVTISSLDSKSVTEGWANICMKNENDWTFSKFSVNDFFEEKVASLYSVVTSAPSVFVYF